MKDENRLISESLNAYLDGELDGETVARLERRLALDARLKRHLHELEQVRAIARATCTVEPLNQAPVSSSPVRRRWVGYGLAATLLVGIGLGMGRWLQPTAPVDDLLASLPPQAQVIRPAVHAAGSLAGERRAVFHVTSANPRLVRSTLNHIERLLRNHDAAGRPLRVEIVANAEGLNALRAETSPARDQIARLHRDYPQVAFLACGTTIARLKHEKGVKVKLLPQASVTSSALDQILLRLREGWTYIRL